MEKKKRSTAILALILTVTVAMLIPAAAIAGDHLHKHDCPDGQILKSEGGEWVCSDDNDTNTDTLADLGCGADQIAKHNGSGWECIDYCSDCETKQGMVIVKSTDFLARQSDYYFHYSDGAVWSATATSTSFGYAAIDLPFACTVTGFEVKYWDPVGGNIVIKLFNESYEGSDLPSPVAIFTSTAHTTPGAGTESVAIAPPGISYDANADDPLYLQVEFNNALFYGIYWVKIHYTIP